MVEKNLEISLCNRTQMYIQYLDKRLQWSFFAKVVNGFYPLSVFTKKILAIKHFRKLENGRALMTSTEQTCLFPL